MGRKVHFLQFVAAAAAAAAAVGFAGRLISIGVVIGMSPYGGYLSAGIESLEQFLYTLYVSCNIVC